MFASKALLTASVSLWSLGALQGAAAQTAPAPAAQPAPAADTGGLEDIVVTAQRRDERQQNVPIAISTVTSSTIARANLISTEGLTQLVPSLQFSRQTSNGGAPFIRGVGSGQASAGSESPVAVYIDDVYVGPASSTSTALNSIDRVEVLKGPQGTLFGRNATGGVVSIHTKRPSQTTAVDATVGYGNYNTVDASLYTNAPLTKTLAINFAGIYHNQQDGYGYDINTGQDVFKSRSYALRTEALWEPGPNTSLLLIADYANEKGDMGLNVEILPGTVSTGGQVSPGKYGATQVPADNVTVSSYGFSGKLNQDLSFARFVSISAWRRALNDFGIDNDGAVANILRSEVHNRTTTVSQELQLLSPVQSKLQWIAGFYYYHSNAGFLPLRSLGTSQAAVGGRAELTSVQKLDTVAGFGELNYEILPATKLTVGLRYTDDMFQLSANRINATGVVQPGYPLALSDSFSKLTYRAVLDHHFTPDVMAYASYSRGFRSGGYNVQTPTVTIAGVVQAAPAIAPEVLDAYEIGLKTEFFNHKLRLNPAIFYYRYNNMQVTVVGNGISTTLNAAAAHIKGIDLDFDAAPTRHLRLVGGVSFLDAKFSSFPSGPYLVPAPGTCTPTPQSTGAPTGGNITCQANLAGYSTPRSPKFTASLNATYTWPTAIGDIGFTTSVYHTASYTWDPDGRLRQPNYTLLGTTLGWTSLNRKYEAKIWARNLTNEYYFNYMSDSGTRDSGQPALPRTYGMTLGVHF